MSRFSTSKAACWLGRNLFAGPWSALLTLVMVAIFVLVLPPLARWALADAVFWGQSRQACNADGACWAFVTARAGFFIYGAYPPEERWRPGLVLFLFFCFAVPVCRERTRGRTWWVVLLVALFPLLGGILLWG